MFHCVLEVNLFDFASIEAAFAHDEKGVERIGVHGLDYP